MASAHDEDPLQEFTANAAHPPLHDVESLVLRHESHRVRRGVQVRRAADHQDPAEDATEDAICERVISTLRRELLDQSLILGGRHLALVLGEYLAHDNAARSHQSRGQRSPDLQTPPARDAADLTDLQTIRRGTVMAGLISEYHHAAYPQLRAGDPLFERYTLTDVVGGYALGATWIARLLALPRAVGAWRQKRPDRRG